MRLEEIDLLCRALVAGLLRVSIRLMQLRDDSAALARKLHRRKPTCCSCGKLGSFLLEVIDSASEVNDRAVEVAGIAITGGMIRETN